MPDGNNLTIDFNDASFDSGDQQPVPGIDVDVVFPLNDTTETVGSGEHEKTENEFIDNRENTGNVAATSIALMPSDSVSGMMEEFMFEFDNDLNDDGDATQDDQGLRIISKKNGVEGIQEIQLMGDFENLHDGGSLDVYINDGQTEGGALTFNSNLDGEPISLGANATKDTAYFVGGDTDGFVMNENDNQAFINVESTSTMGGTFSGAGGMDYLELVEGVISGNGAVVSFQAGLGDANSAFVSTLGDGNLAFYIDEFELIKLTDSNDIITIGSQTGVGVTNYFDASYFGGGSNSMLMVQTGFTDGGLKDVVEVHADSNLMLDFDFASDYGVGVDAVFNSNGGMTVTGTGGTANSPTIDVLVKWAGGAELPDGSPNAMSVDYLVATNNQDTVTNQGDIGVTVNLGRADTGVDEFLGSSSSGNDILDARETHTLAFMNSTANSGYINVKGESELGGWLDADLKSVDYIMVRDTKLENITESDQIWDNMGNVDVDFYKDNSHLNGSQIISGLGLGASDSYGAGYDVMTSAQIDSFGSDNNLRIFYEGSHSDFTDTGDTVVGEEGQFSMVTGSSANGSTWESDILGGS